MPSSSQYRRNTRRRLSDIAARQSTGQAVTYSGFNDNGLLRGRLPRGGRVEAISLGRYLPRFGELEPGTIIGGAFTVEI